MSHVLRILHRLKLRDGMAGMPIDEDAISGVKRDLDPQLAERIKRRQLALLERHVVATRSNRTVWPPV